MGAGIRRAGQEQGGWFFGNDQHGCFGAGGKSAGDSTDLRINDRHSQDGAPQSILRWCRLVIQIGSVPFPDLEDQFRLFFFPFVYSFF